ncbi:hypothetical protein VTL71DRAFT_7460 [Oculimacula yallundae]|uniref:Uncharacterized protein n=1 Tax=Oculimacula yallundae TaxID=86028 RepID=A0ABR4BV01_9HELO
MKFNILQCLLGFVVLAFAQNIGIPAQESLQLFSSTVLESSTAPGPSSTVQIEASSTLALPGVETTALPVFTGYIETMVSLYLPSSEAPIPTPVSTPELVAEPDPTPTPTPKLDDPISSLFLEIQSSYAPPPSPETRVSIFPGYDPETTSAKVPGPLSSIFAIPTSVLVLSSSSKVLLNPLSSAGSVCLCPSAIFTSTSVVISTSTSIIIPQPTLPAPGGGAGTICPLATTATVTRVTVIRQPGGATGGITTITKSTTLTAYLTAPVIQLPASTITTTKTDVSTSTLLATATTTLTPPSITCPATPSCPRLPPPAPTKPASVSTSIIIVHVTSTLTLTSTATRTALTKTIVTDTVTVTKVKTVVTRIRTTLVVLVTRTKVEVVWTTNTVLNTGVVTRTSVRFETVTSTVVRTRGLGNLAASQLDTDVAPIAHEIGQPRRPCACGFSLNAFHIPSRLLRFMMAMFLIFTSCVLIALTPMSYIPVYKSLFLRSTNGVSITAAFLLALCAQAQLVTMYYLWVCPPSKRDGLVIPKPPLLMDYLNLVQLIEQWICSLLFLSFFLEAHDSEETGLRRTAKSPSNKTAFRLLTLHACLCVLWIFLAGSPTDDWLDLPFVVIMGINNYCINPIITITTGVALTLQAITAKQNQGQSVSNQTFLLLQAVVFLALAISWPFRFKVPQNLHHVDFYFFKEWYPLVRWTCINGAIIGIGQAAVLCFSIANRRAGNEVAQEGEREALLST